MSQTLLREQQQRKSPLPPFSAVQSLYSTSCSVGLSLMFFLKWLLCFPYWRQAFMPLCVQMHSYLPCHSWANSALATWFHSCTIYRMVLTLAWLSWMPWSRLHCNRTTLLDVSWWCNKWLIGCRLTSSNTFDCKTLLLRWWLHSFPWR